MLALSACGDDRTGRVASYLSDANAIQRSAAPELARANKIYAGYAGGQATVTAGTADLERAERAIRSTHESLARLRPPAEARRLQRLILEYYDRGTRLARETTALGRYLPAAARSLRPLDRLNRRFRRRLLAATTVRGQATALGHYATGLNRVVARLRKLEPPPVLRPAHRTQLARLGAARTLARRLERAVLRRDAKAVKTLLVRFRRLIASRPAPELSRRALRAYNRRYDGLNRTAAAVNREWQRLELSLT